MNAPGTSSKDLVRDLPSRLPEPVSLRNLAREIECVAAVREGLAELDDLARDLRPWIVQ